VDREPLDTRVTVAVVEDQPVTVDGVRAWFDRDPLQRAVVVAAGDTIETALATGGDGADVLLLDLDLRGVIVTGRIADLCAAGHRVVVFSALTDSDTVHAVHAAGASGFLGKHETSEHLIAAVVAAAGDRPYVTPSVAGAIAADPQARTRLSEQERTALLLWFQSMSKRSVALRMGVQESTVRQYIQRARLKYAAAGRPAPTQSALLARAIEDGLIRPEDVRNYRSLAAD
jgi:two-component system, NarL family, nitrate/nitrite response regulator NarL